MKRGGAGRGALRIFLHSVPRKTGTRRGAGMKVSHHDENRTGALAAAVNCRDGSKTPPRCLSINEFQRNQLSQNQEKKRWRGKMTRWLRAVF